MVTEKQIQLIKTLIDKTNSGKLEWQSGVNDGSFQLSFSNSTLELFERNNRNGEISFVVTMRNGFGEIVDQISDDELDAGRSYINAKDSYYYRMQQLLEMARRTALGSDALLNEILSELDAD